jgi:hypothetical protein
VFVTSTRLIFVGKGMSLPLEQSPARGSFHVGSNLANKYYTRVEVTGSGKYFG